MNLVKQNVDNVPVHKVRQKEVGMVFKVGR